MDLNTKEILIALIGFLSGASISVPITIKVMKSTLNVNKVKQRGIISSGDVIGRDKFHK